MTRVIDVAKGEHHQAKEPLDPFDVIRLAKAGRTAQEAADELGFALWTVRNTAREVGVKFRNPRMISPEDEAAIRKMADEGWSHREIAARTGRSKSGIQKLLAR